MSFSLCPLDPWLAKLSGSPPDSISARCTIGRWKGCVVPCAARRKKAPITGKVSRSCLRICIRPYYGVNFPAILRIWRCFLFPPPRISNATGGVFSAFLWMQLLAW